MTLPKGQTYKSQKRVYSGSAGRKHPSKTPHHSLDVLAMNELFIRWGILGRKHGR